MRYILWLALLILIVWAATAGIFILLFDWPKEETMRSAAVSAVLLGVTLIIQPRLPK